MNQSHHHTCRGFTITEMAVVVIVIGLIVGGVMVGRNMVASAELQSILADRDRYIQAVNTFRDKYKALPGDMANATDYWGQLGVPGLCHNEPYDGIKTCNGDDNGRIQRDRPTPAEDLRAWQHLAAAGLIDGNYTGRMSDLVTPANVPILEAGINAPASSRDGAVFSLHYISSNRAGTVAQRYIGSYGHVLLFEAYFSGFVRRPALSPVEAHTIDLKIDDGKPGKGNVRTWKHLVDPDCVTAPVVAAPDTIEEKAEYKLDNDFHACGLLFITGF